MLLSVTLAGCAAGPARTAASAEPAEPSPDVLPEVNREFRGAWIATVANIDWPSEKGLSVEQQQQEFIGLLDIARDMGLNAVVFQVRTSADALYRSKHEPWSAFLTGEQGKDPGYDPLDFAIEEAHQRGLELHAWINPLRASHPSHDGPAVAEHVSNTLPEATPQYGSMRWMDPGHPETLKHTMRVVSDLVRNYDIDGLHIDDYFYPYPQRDEDGNAIEFPDQETFARYGRGMSRSDWRRDNVNRMVKAMHEQIKRVKPHVKFGISPFGIWRPGQPSYIKGMDQYEAIYADARLWLHEGWCDYFTPQLYWVIDNPDQSFIGLLQWWQSENKSGRHLWPGLYASRTEDGSSRQFDGKQIPFQVRWSRILLPEQEPGHIHFSIKAFQQNRGGLAESLPKIYAEPALTPAMPWLKTDGRLRAPRVASAQVDGGQVQLELDTRRTGAARWVSVQRWNGSRWSTQIFPAHEATLSFADVAAEDAADSLWVRAFDRLGNGTDAVEVALERKATQASAE